jgi:hypothetical protein
LKDDILQGCKEILKQELAKVMEAPPVTTNELKHKAPVAKYSTPVLPV